MLICCWGCGLSVLRRPAGCCSPAQVLLLTSSAEGPKSLICPWPSTMRSSSWEVPERDMPTAGQDSDWNWRAMEEWG